MKIAILIARILLGLLFFASGLMGIIHPMAPSSALPPDAVAYSTILATHHYMTFVELIMLVGGLLLLVGRYVPLALTLLGPVIVNILLFHALIDPSHPSFAIPGTIAALLELFLIYTYRLSFRGLFDAAPELS